MNRFFLGLTLLLFSEECLSANDYSLHTTRYTLQEEDTLLTPRSSLHTKEYAPHYKQLILPGVLITASAIAVGSDWMEIQNREMRDELQEEVKSKFPIDDYTQYSPMVAAYALDWCGVKARHGFADRTLILATAYALMGISVNTLKCATRIERPDGTSRNSFPSGHTATAFMGAELLRLEYADVSPWIGVAGYIVATGTGFFRMYNNRHWATDIVMGAGIGILSTRAAYWLYPTLSRIVFPRKHNNNIAVAPFVGDSEKGLSCQINF